ncbi:hypothetical protein OUZ56_003047 [Daphnia magna]|uniref:Uncharacterized protein n=1 Tax=Daphnia magna TaxID=35525 RepID=A0ABR0A7S5_9CRUS|nr:hypothetical protein OUZ56_003047 [Daphnia magna]
METKNSRHPHTKAIQTACPTAINNLANFNCYCLRKKCNSFRKPRKERIVRQIGKKNREMVSQMSLVNLVAHRTSCHGMESCSVKTVPSFSQEKEECLRSAVAASVDVLRPI